MTKKAPNIRAAPPKRIYIVIFSPEKKLRALPILIIITVIIGVVRRSTDMVELRICSSDFAKKR